MHALDVVSLGFQSQETEELFFLFLQVDYISAFAHASWRVWAEAEEVTENIMLYRRFFQFSLSVISHWSAPSSNLRRRLRWGKLLWFRFCDDVLISYIVNHCLSFLHIISRGHGILVNNGWQPTSGRLWCQCWRCCSRPFDASFSWLLFLHRLNKLRWVCLLRGRSAIHDWCWLVGWQAEVGFDHWKFLVIFTKISIIFIIVLVIEKGDPLSKGVPILSLGDVPEVLDV